MTIHRERRLREWALDAHKQLCAVSCNFEVLRRGLGRACGRQGALGLLDASPASTASVLALDMQLRALSENALSSFNYAKVLVEELAGIRKNMILTRQADAQAARLRELAARPNVDLETRTRALEMLKSGGHLDSVAQSVTVEAQEGTDGSTGPTATP